MLTWRLCPGGKRVQTQDVEEEYSEPLLKLLISTANLIPPSHSLRPLKSKGPFPLAQLLVALRFFFLLIEETTVLQIKMFGEEMLCFILPCFVQFEKKNKNKINLALNVKKTKPGRGHRVYP